MSTLYKSATPFALSIANAVLGSLFFGYSISYLNPAANSYPVYYDIIQYDQGTQNVLKALVGSLFTLAAGAGAMFSGQLLSKFSIRQAFMVTDFIGICGVLLEIWPNVYVFMLARIIIGFCVGLNSSLVPQYIKEFSPSDLSGPLGALNQLTINVGILFGLITAFFYQSNNVQLDINDKTILICFELPIAICALRTTLLFFIFTNEPPSYYILKSETAQATQVLEQYYFKERVKEVLEKIQAAQYSKDLNKDSYGDLFKIPSKRKKLFIGCGLQILQQFSGINAIMFFSGIIFGQILNNDTQKINWANTIIGIINIIFSIIAVRLLKQFGRKQLLFYGTIICTLFLGVAFGFSFDLDPATMIQIFIVLSIFGYLGAFQVSLGPVAWIYDADILSEQGMSIAVLCNWICCSIIAFAFVILDIENHKNRLSIVFGVFTGCCVIGVLFIWKFIQETKDRTQSTIDKMFSLVNAKEAGLLG